MAVEAREGKTAWTGFVLHAALHTTVWSAWALLLVVFATRARVLFLELYLHAAPPSDWPWLTWLTLEVRWLTWPLLGGLVCSGFCALAWKSTARQRWHLLATSVVAATLAAFVGTTAVLVFNQPGMIISLGRG